MRPALTWGEASSPIRVKSDMVFRMVAGDRKSPLSRASVRDPTGWPVDRKLSTIVSEDVPSAAVHIGETKMWWYTRHERHVGSEEQRFKA